MRDLDRDRKVLSQRAQRIAKKINVTPTALNPRAQRRVGARDQSSVISVQGPKFRDGLFFLGFLGLIPSPLGASLRASAFMDYGVTSGESHH